MLPLPLVFFWGCVGGLACAVILFILPSLLGAHRRGEPANISRDNVLVVITLMVIFTLLAGLGTIFVGNIDSVSMALKVGFGVQGLIKGVAAGGRDLVRSPGSSP